MPSCVNLYQSVPSVQLTKKIVRRLINPKSISVHQVPSLIAGTRLVHRWQATTLYAESADPARKNLDHQCHGHTNIRENDKWDKDCFTDKKKRWLITINVYLISSGLTRPKIYLKQPNLISKLKTRSEENGWEGHCHDRRME